MDLKTTLLKWDRKNTDILSEWYARNKDTSGVVDQLISHLTDIPCQEAASWLLKYHIEQQPKKQRNSTLSKAQMAQIFSALNAFKSWQTQLHFLQILPYLEIPQEHCPSLEYFVRQHISGNNKFVKAWAYNGFYLLACQYPEYQAEVLSFLQMAMEDEAPSIKARVRKALAQGF